MLVGQSASLTSEPAAVRAPACPVTFRNCRRTSLLFLREIRSLHSISRRKPGSPAERQSPVRAAPHSAAFRICRRRTLRHLQVIHIPRKTCCRLLWCRTVQQCRSSGRTSYRRLSEHCSLYIFCSRLSLLSSLRSAVYTACNAQYQIK